MKQNFYNRFIDYALKAEQKTGIKAVFILAQAALESGWGKSAPKSNFFGIKATKNTPENKKQLLTTNEVVSADTPTNRNKFPEVISVAKRSDGRFLYKVKDWFKAYDTPEEAFTDHANLFFRVKNYANALNFKNDPYKFAEEIHKAGYATDPNYATSLKTIIKEMENFSKKK